MTTEQIVKKRDYFDAITWRHLSCCMKCLDEGIFSLPPFGRQGLWSRCSRIFSRRFGDKSYDCDGIEGTPDFLKLIHRNP